MILIDINKSAFIENFEGRGKGIGMELGGGVEKVLKNTKKG